MNIKDYKIAEKIGEGSLGVVYLATKERSKDLVAIKEQKGPNIENAMYESKILEKISQKCDNILNYQKSFILNGNHYLITDYIKGTSLYDLEKYDMSKEDPTNILNLIAQLFNALSCLHNNDVVHRDVKNSNIMIQVNKNNPIDLNDANLTLIDFGLACDSKSCNYKSKDGTPAYKSPELIINTKYNFEIYKASDVWAAGVCFYFLFNKTPPIPARVEFIMMRPDFTKMINYIKSNKPIDRLNFKDERVVGIISSCLNYDYTKRIKASEVLEVEI